MRTQIMLETLEHARFNPTPAVKYTSIRYGERLAEIGAHPSIGTIGDRYDSALAEAVDGLDRSELIYDKGPWRTVWVMATNLVRTPRPR